MCVHIDCHVHLCPGTCASNSSRRQRLTKRSGSQNKCSLKGPEARLRDKASRNFCREVQSRWQPCVYILIAMSVFVLESAPAPATADKCSLKGPEARPRDKALRYFCREVGSSSDLQPPTKSGTHFAAPAIGPRCHAGTTVR